MTIDVKDLGQISRFNGVDVMQTKEYVKIYNKTYLNKIFLRHEWLNQEMPTSKFPIPMQPDARYQQKLENADIPTQAEISKLE
jgi:hypothetical protein